MIKMNLSIRNYIISNFKNDDLDELEKAIDESIASGDEETLPGMGVFLELIWQGADDKLKQEMLSIIKEKINSSN